MAIKMERHDEIGTLYTTREIEKRIRSFQNRLSEIADADGRVWLSSMTEEDVCEALSLLEIAWGYVQAAAYLEEQSELGADPLGIENQQ